MNFLVIFTPRISGKFVYKLTTSNEMNLVFGSIISLSFSVNYKAFLIEYFNM